jgi:hypothetical protein
LRWRNDGDWLCVVAAVAEIVFISSGDIMREIAPTNWKRQA